MHKYIYTHVLAFAHAVRLLAQHETTELLRVAVVPSWIEGQNSFRYFFFFLAVRTCTYLVLDGQELVVVVGSRKKQKGEGKSFLFLTGQ